MKFFVVRFGREHFSVHQNYPTGERIEEIRKDLSAARRYTRPRVEEWEVVLEGNDPVILKPRGRYLKFSRGRQVTVPYVRFGRPDETFERVGVPIRWYHEGGNYGREALLLMMKQPGIVSFIEEAPKKRMPAHGHRIHFVRGPRYRIVGHTITPCD